MRRFSQSEAAAWLQLALHRFDCCMAAKKRFNVRRFQEGQGQGVGDIGASSAGDALTKQEIVAAALAAMREGKDGPCSSACVSLNEVLSACPDIANAAEQERGPSRCWSFDPMMTKVREAPIMTQARQSTMSRSPDLVKLEDITVHFSLDGRVYEVVLQSPCLHDGEVYGAVDVPTDLT
ncbi:MAG: hypothetical protein DRI90_15215 [Deltaproteobacteria bacterium]|nr:MAG: hypothetical protein DRI90_15215 [Deltaproteobacteria bacterium]